MLRALFRKLKLTVCVQGVYTLSHANKSTRYFKKPTFTYHVQISTFTAFKLVHCDLQFEKDQSASAFHSLQHFTSIDKHLLYMQIAGLAEPHDYSFS